MLNLKERDLLTLFDYKSSEIEYLLDLAGYLKKIKETGIFRSYCKFQNKRIFQR